jgi:hypothetical protein
MELFGLEAGTKKMNWGKPGVAIWIMGLPLERQKRYADTLAKLMLEMSREELAALKYYVAYGSWIGLELWRKEAA